MRFEAAHTGIGHRLLLPSSDINSRLLRRGPHGWLSAGEAGEMLGRRYVVGSYVHENIRRKDWERHAKGDW